MKNQKKSGVLLSYLTLIFNSLFGILFTPYLISSLGTSEYGVYQLINSFAGYLIILNFGMNTVITRYVAKYRTNKEEEEQANFLFASVFITVGLVILILLVGSILYMSLDTLFSDSLSNSELSRVKILYILLVINISLTIVMNSLSGIIMGYEKFAITNGMKLVRIVLKYLILLVLLSVGFKSIALVSTDLFLTVSFILIELIYCIKVLKVKIKFKYFDRKLIWSITTFSLAVLMQSVVNQVNQNLDSVILGSMMGAETVSLYSISLIFLTTFSSLTGTIGSVFVPEATRMIEKGASNEELTDFIIKPGRLQFMLGGAIVSGFILFGENFIKIWVGEEFIGAYLPAVILLIPALLPLVQNVANAVLDAKMKRMGRSVILVCMAIVNLILTVILVKLHGYIGAAIGTGISFIIGNIVLMNLYYKLSIGLNVVRMLKEIFKGTLKVIIVTSLLLMPLAMLIPDTIPYFVLKISVFMTVYIILLQKISFNDFEKRLFYSFFEKTIKLKRAKIKL